MEQARAKTEVETAGIRIVASTDSKDRDGRIVHQDGWELDPFKANPVLMFDHGYLDENGRKIPIARVGQIDVIDGRLIAGEITWAKDPFSQMVREMYEPSDGSPPIMQAASAGWIPLESPVQKEDGEHHIRQELAELSLTAIPSNRDTNAVIMAAFRGLVHGSATVESGEGEASPVDSSPEPATVSSPSPAPSEAVIPLTDANLNRLAAAVAKAGGFSTGTSTVTAGNSTGTVYVPAGVAAGVAAAVASVDEEATADAEATALLAPPETETPAPAEETEEPNGEGSAPATESGEQASGLTTRQKAERVAAVTAAVTERMYRQLTGRLPD